jgi:hypothetical protein
LIPHAAKRAGHFLQGVCGQNRGDAKCGRPCAGCVTMHWSQQSSDSVESLNSKKMLLNTSCTSVQTCCTYFLSVHYCCLRDLVSSHKWTGTGPRKHGRAGDALHLWTHWRPVVQRFRRTDLPNVVSINIGSNFLCLQICSHEICTALVTEASQNNPKEI